MVEMMVEIQKESKKRCWFQEKCTGLIAPEKTGELDDRKTTTTSAEDPQVTYIPLTLRNADKARLSSARYVAIFQ